MARRLRFPLLALLALQLLVAGLLTRPVEASGCNWSFTPTCQNGNTSYGPQCYPLCQGSCHIGTICFYWECVDGHPTNVRNQQSFKGCYYWNACCS
jgi:hypothetical protein